jgi:Tol biopolymer transport system component
MQNFERVIAEAQECFQVWQDKPVFQYYTFCGLTALGEYEAATTLFHQIISAGYVARSRFQDWCAKYVFDTLGGGRSWHPADREPVGAAFLPMVEAEEMYRGLAAKSRRVTADGFSAAWSPDGKKLAFSLGVQGRSGVAIFDPATKETDLLIVPGKDPKWSPDGRYLAFVRDREGLRPEELAATGGEGKQPPETGEEVWLMNADGTEPRCLTHGSWPSWGSDSQHLYYLSRGDGMLCSLSLVGQDAKPKRILKCSNALPSVSPDNRQVAYFEGGLLKIKDLASQSPIAECPVASLSWGVTAWSLAGNEVCLGGGDPARPKNGLWLYDLTRTEFSRVLDGPIQSVSWSPTGAELAFCVGSPYQEIWVAPLRPGMSTAEVLGPCRTPREHHQEMVALYTRRIKADPMDADAYLQRAQWYHCLHEEARVHADMRQYTAIVTQGRPLDSWFGWPWNYEHTIDGPFGYQLVFSIEERDNRIQALCVAFGQKGRGSMKSLKTSMFAMSLVWLDLLAGFDTPPTYADFVFGDSVKTEATVQDIIILCFSYDGLEMYIESYGDLCVKRRDSTDGPWGASENLGPLVNSPNSDSSASISNDGLTLYFNSDRPGGHGSWDVYMTTRPTKKDPWGKAVNVGPPINSSYVDGEPWITQDGRELYFISYRPGGYGKADIWVTRRETENGPWQDAVNLGPLVNSPYEEQFFSLSSDGLLLLFCEYYSPAGPFRPGGYGQGDIWMTKRSSVTDPWQEVVNLGPAVNGPAVDILPRVSPDGQTLYFVTETNNGPWYTWEVPIVRVCDFDGDSKVNDRDVAILRAHWGEKYPPCDIGPMPWGDGVVDAKDLTVLMETINGTGVAFDPVPHALEVPREVVLSWPSIDSAQVYDVYLGISSEDVSRADRSDPQGVLVSQGQTATTYDPPGSLEFGRTYYWRIDVVGEDATVQKGAVLKFTTEAFAYPITTNIIATAYSSQPGMGPENTIDGSGLDENEGHSTDGNAMWLSKNTGPHWIQFAFDKVYALHELWVWNSNQVIEPILGFGAKTVKVEYSVDGATWTTLDYMPEFARAPGESGYKPNTTVGFGGASAKYVKLTIEANWGGLAQTGLAEVRFFSIPVYASQPTPATGRKGMGADTILTWRAGRQAAQHRVYLGTEEQAVTSGEALIATVSDTRFDPGPLNLGTVYYWRIDEVNEAVTPSARQGEVWSFTTKEYSIVDDFESYTDDEGSRIYESWLDGLTNGDGGSQVGYDTSPFTERMVVHGGRQSMPVHYNNAALPFVSEAQRMFSPVQDWTVNGVDTLALWFRGNPIAFQERAGGGIQISGGGADIWGNSDQFRFAYKHLKGDGSIVAKVHNLTDSNIWAKAGVMIRGSLDAASTYAFMTPTPEGRRAFQNRSTGGGTAKSAHSDLGVICLPLWLKVERKGSNFTGYYSQDGKNWTLCQPDATATPLSDSTNPSRIMMTDDVYIGLAVTSHNVSMPAIAEFSDVSFTGAVTGDWQVEAIGVEQPSNDPAPLYVAIEDDAGKVKTITHPDPAAVLAIAWQQWLIPLSDLTSAGVRLTSVKKMSIGIGDPSHPTAGGAGVIYIDDIGVGHPLSE